MTDMRALLVTSKALISVKNGSSGERGGASPSVYFVAPHSWWAVAPKVACWQPLVPTELTAQVHWLTRRGLPPRWRTPVRPDGETVTRRCPGIPCNTL